MTFLKTILAAIFSAEKFIFSSPLHLKFDYCSWALGLILYIWLVIRDCDLKLELNNIRMIMIHLTFQSHK